MGKIDFKKYPYLENIGGEATMPDEGIEDFSCRGWAAVLTNMFDQINAAMDAAQVPRSALNIIQIKEKFGSLRMYYDIQDIDLSIPDDVKDRLDDQIEDIVNRAENVTERTCVVCGAKAEYFSTGWVLPYCEHCARENHRASNARHKTEFNFDQSWVKISK